MIVEPTREHWRVFRSTTPLVGATRAARTNMRYGAVVPDGRFALDPFGAVPNEASRIAGMGGAESASEPGYVFRTVPIAAPVGSAAFLIALHGLAARDGTISIELSVVPDHPDAVSLQVVTVVRTLATLVIEGGRLLIPFEAHRAHLYAVAGYSHDNPALTASALTVELLGSSEATALARTMPAGSIFTPLSIEPVPIPRLRALDLPDFRDPLSQPMTAEQCCHPDFTSWREQLGIDRSNDAEDIWSEAYPLQVFLRFGALVPGARAMGINVGHQAVPAVLARLGCKVLCAEHAEPADSFDEAVVLRRLQRPSVCTPEALQDAVRCIGIDLRRPDIVRADHDIVWSDRRASQANFEDAFWLAMHRLKPGGLCVHIFSYDPVGQGDPDTPGRARVERLAVNAISFGHDVVQLCFRTRSEDRRHMPRRVPFALIARRT